MITRPIDKHAGPAVKFVFRYRPAGMSSAFWSDSVTFSSECDMRVAILQAQGIMPAQASEAGPSAPRRDMKVKTRASTVSVSQEDAEDGDVPATTSSLMRAARRQRKRVKRERSDTLLDGDVIDLSDDDAAEVDVSLFRACCQLLAVVAELEALVPIVLQRKPFVKQEPQPRRSYDPNDIIDLTSD